MAPKKPKKKAKGMPKGMHMMSDGLMLDSDMPMKMTNKKKTSKKPAKYK